MDNPGDADSAAVAAGMDAAANAAAAEGFTPSSDLSDISPSSNVVQDASGGGWQTGGGGALGSAGLNISLGLDSNTPAFGPLVGTQTTPAGQMSLDAAAQALGLTPEDLQAVQAQSAFQSALVGGMPSMLSTSGLDLTTLNQLSEAGFGSSPVSNTQTVDQALATMNAHTALNTALPGLMASLVPGGNIALSGLNAFNALQSGKSTPGQALTSFGLGALGVPGPVVSAMQGQFGPAAGGLAQAGLTGLLSPSMGAMAGPALNLSGVGPTVGQAVSNAVPNAQDPGILSGISNALDQALSGFSGFSLGNIAPGTPPTPGSMQALDNGTGISQETYPVAAAIEQAAREFKPPTRGREMVAGRYGPTVQYEFGA